MNYTIEDCIFGRLLVGFTDLGISFIHLGNDDVELEDAIKKRYPKALNGKVCEWSHDILRYLKGEISHTDPPLDIRGTEFQLEVWKELRKIPYGEVRSYSDIAEALGDKNKARAVANACGSNPVPFIIPCHRVIRGDGSLGGYYYGRRLKKRLLRREIMSSE
jgi:AraC family transcriptional regulator of adaptative response/methylated-DNA-[protein]-cysteine methyltransferase